MDEGRKRVLLIAASILAARRFAQMDRRQLHSAAADIAMTEAISLAERLLQRIDAKWPAAPWVFTRKPTR